MQPLFNRVFVIPYPEEHKTASGLTLSQSDFVRGKVLYVGTTCEPSIHPGDAIIYNKDQGSKYNYKGVDGLFFHDKDLITIL